MGYPTREAASAAFRAEIQAGAQSTPCMIGVKTSSPTLTLEAANLLDALGRLRDVRSQVESISSRLNGPRPDIVGVSTDDPLPTGVVASLGVIVRNVHTLVSDIQVHLRDVENAL